MCHCLPCVILLFPHLCWTKTSCKTQHINASQGLSVLKKRKRLELPEVYSFIHCTHILYGPAMGIQETLQKQRAKQCPQGAHGLAAGDTAGPGTALGAGYSQGQRETERQVLIVGIRKC